MSVFLSKFECGLSFAVSENLPSFSQLKNTTHKTMSDLKDKVSKEQEVLYKQSKDVAINCASAAYMSYKLDFHMPRKFTLLVEILARKIILKSLVVTFYC